METPGKFGPSLPYWLPRPEMQSQAEADLVGARREKPRQFRDRARRLALVIKGRGFYWQQGE